MLLYAVAFLALKDEGGWVDNQKQPSFSRSEKFFLGGLGRMV